MTTYGIVIPASTVQDVRDTVTPTNSHIAPLPERPSVVKSREISKWRRMFGK